MPRKPTIYVKIAREGILALLAGCAKNDALPTLRELGEKFTLHPSTIFRLLKDLETEGAVWQGPSGRFFPTSARSQTLRGAPICFIGREMWQWSQLYQEIMEGVAEVCSANGSPLIFHSAPNLVRVPVQLEAPIFASAHEQKKSSSRSRPPSRAARPASCSIIFGTTERSARLPSRAVKNSSSSTAPGSTPKPSHPTPKRVSR